MMQTSRTLAKEAVIIRRLTADDLDRLFDPAERVLGEQWLAQQERGEMYVAVAEVNGAPVGRRCLNFTWSKYKGVGYCFAAAVRPEWQSQGIGTRIDEHCESVARTRGLRALRCAVDKENTRSSAWHERCGYKRIGESVVRWTDLDGREVELDCWKFERSFELPYRSHWRSIMLLLGAGAQQGRRWFSLFCRRSRPNRSVGGRHLS